MSKCPTVLKWKINKLARLFYKMQGYNVEDNYDFTKSVHPTEMLMWNMALIAYDVIEKSDLYREFRLGD